MLYYVYHLKVPTNDTLKISTDFYFIIEKYLLEYWMYNLYDLYLFFTQKNHQYFLCKEQT